MATAQDIAEELGREWIDCGAYERMSFEDEARRRNAARDAREELLAEQLIEEQRRLMPTRDELAIQHDWAAYREKHGPIWPDEQQQ